LQYSLYAWTGQVVLLDLCHKYTHAHTHNIYRSTGIFLKVGNKLQEDVAELRVLLVEALDARVEVDQELSAESADGAYVAEDGLRFGLEK
jgi:hypothetical protein